MIIVGDCDSTLPLRQQVKPIFDAGIRVRWIPGNHDVDEEYFYDRLWGDYPQGNLHGAWCPAGDMIVGGLGCVFFEHIWYPRFEAADPVHASRRHYMHRLPKNERWRGGMPLRPRSAIFPEDVLALKGLRLDVLVTHEAPSSHRHGFLGIDAAASLCRAKMVVHGHHHESYAGVLPDGTPVRGLAKREILRVRRADLVPI